jgi:hypothetical protein
MSDLPMTSQLKVLLEREATERPLSRKVSAEREQIEQFEIKLEQIDRAFSLVNEIRSALEAALQDLPQQD